MKLDKRLNMLYNMVRYSSKLADIGTDHGYLPAKLILDHKCPNAIAVDINIKPLTHAKELVHKLGLENKIDLRLSSGLTNIKDSEVDDIHISGMGSELIIDIISR